MAIIETGTRELEGLRSRMQGHVATPDDGDWDSARQAWNLLADQHPHAVAFPVSERDVIAAVEYAREAGLRINVQGTGHNALPLGDMSDTLLLRTSDWRDVMIDPVARIARVRPGAIWDDVVQPAAEHDLAALAGSSPDVGVVGYSLGGGIGYMARRYGMQTNAITAIELVTADGELVRADASHNSDLFWAVRGGGGNFGIVTALEFRLFDVGPIYAGAMIYPLVRAQEILRAWRDWTAALPDCVTSMARLIRFPDVEFVPEPMRGQEVVVVTAAVTGDDDLGRALMRPMADLGPIMDTFGPMPIAGLSRLHGDPEEPSAGVGEHKLLESLTDETIEAILEHVGPGKETPLLGFELRHLGGALGRAAAGSGALPKLDGQFIAFGVGLALSDEMAAAVEHAARRLMASLAPWSEGRMYLNFAERAINTRAGYGVEAYERLREIRAAVDPDGLLRANHEIA
jgi:FAD/FMN-containing dehydrogenase